MDKIWYKYIGYYIEKTEKSKSITNKEKKIRECFPDEIFKEAKGEKAKLLSVIDKVSSDKTTRYAIIIFSFKELGETKEQIFEMYKKIIDVAEIFVIKYPELSTIDLHNNIIVDKNNNWKAMMYEKLKGKFYKKANNERMNQKKEIKEKKFRKVFWAWQNYFIETKDIVELTGFSKPTFVRFSQEYMTSSDYREIYEKEYALYMEDYEDKPIRGLGPVTDKSDEYTILRYLTREIEGKWTVEQIENICKENLNTIKFIAQDYIRMRKNCCDGRAAMFVATEKYNKGPEYIEKLKNELAEIS